jgi:hypothetical protein
MPVMQQGVCADYHLHMALRIQDVPLHHPRFAAILASGSDSTPSIAGVMHLHTASQH